MTSRVSPSLLMVATVSGTIRHFLIPVAAHMQQLGWTVHAAAAGATTDPGLGQAFDHTVDLPLSRSIRDVRGMLASEQALSELIGTTQPDVVHVHTPIASFLTRVAIRRAPASRRPALAYTAHGFHFHAQGRLVTNAVFLTAERVAGRWTDRLIVINDEDEAAARRHRLVRPGRLIRHPGVGLDTSRYAPSAIDPGSVADFRRRLQVTRDTPLFVVIGELNHNKRQGDAIAALARSTNTQAHLVIVGDGPLRPDLEARSRELDVAGRVHFTGWLDDVRTVLGSATALIAPSRREGLSRSVMEALSLGVPVVASAARGNAELVGDSGYITGIGDVAAIAQSMDRLADRPDERREMGARGRERMVDRYDIGVVVALHEALYESLLIERSGTPKG